jgi:hypothetical protein
LEDTPLPGRSQGNRTLLYQGDLKVTGLEDTLSERSQGNRIGGLSITREISRLQDWRTVLFQEYFKVTRLEDCPLPEISQGNRIGGLSSTRDISR